MIINSVIGATKSTGVKSYAEGTVQVSSATRSFELYSGDEYDQLYVEVKRNLGFVPSLIIMVVAVNGVDAQCMFKRDGWWNDEPKSQIKYEYDYYALSKDAYVNKNGFRLPFPTTSGYSVKWYAYE